MAVMAASQDPRALPSWPRLLQIFWEHELILIIMVYISETKSSAWEARIQSRSQRSYCHFWESREKQP